MAWGDKGEEYRPSDCNHAPDDGCMWCCRNCNLDLHRCPICGTVANHKEDACGDQECEDNGARIEAKLRAPIQLPTTPCACNPAKGTKCLLHFDLDGYVINKALGGE